MESFESYAATLLNGFNAETSKFAAALKEELCQRKSPQASNPLLVIGTTTFAAAVRLTSEGDNALSAECQKLRTELECLPQDAAKAQHLEQENAILRSKLERAANRKPHTPKQDDSRAPPVISTTLRPLDKDVRREREGSTLLTSSVNLNQEVSQLRRIMKEKDRAYASLMEKHLKMTKKFRQVKENAESWQTYHKKSMAKSARTEHAGSAGEGSRIDKPPNSYITPAPSDPKSASSSTRKEDTVAEYSLIHLSGVESPYTSKPNPIDSFVALDPSATPENRPSGQSFWSIEYVQNGACKGEQKHVSKLFSQTIQLESSTAIMVNQLETPASRTSRGKVVNDHDSPIRIAQRSLKRERPRDPSPPKSSGVSLDTGTRKGVGSIAKPISVKNEHGSSPIVHDNLRSLNMIHDSLDLDEVGARTFTPKKRKKASEYIVAQYAATTGAAFPAYLWPHTPLATTGGSVRLPGKQMDTVSNLEVETYEKDVYAQTDYNYGMKLWKDEQLRNEAKRLKEQKDLGAQVPGNLQGLSRLARQHMHNQKTHARQRKSNETSCGVTADHDWRFNGDTAKDSRLGNNAEAVDTTQQLQKVTLARSPTIHVLKSKTLNGRFLPRTTVADKKLHRRARRGSGSGEISMLTEDGENIPGQSAEKREVLRPNMPPSSRESQQTPNVLQFHRRLHGLLDRPSADKLPLSNCGEPSEGMVSIKCKLPETDVVLRANSTTTHDLPSRHTNTTRSYAEKDLEQYRSRVSALAHPCDEHLAEAASSTAPGSCRLRNRPPHSLQLDDFKLSPVTNKGFDSPFDENFRNRDQRRCLAHSTKPECCGDKFNRAVKVGGLPMPLAHGIRASSPIAQEEEYLNLLHEDLELDARAIRDMPEAEKKKLLSRAKANRFGKEYGKHRYVHERPASPPGFWRTEMPTTQEAEADRREAAVVERKKVEGRYREALKGGGKWIFRDE